MNNQYLVLIVEDNPKFLKYEVGLCQEAGMIPFPTNSLQAAFEEIRRNPHFDLAVLDINLTGKPGNRDGLSLAEQLRAEFPHLFLAGYSANDSLSTRQQRAFEVFHDKTQGDTASDDSRWNLYRGKANEARTRRIDSGENPNSGSHFLESVMIKFEHIFKPADRPGSEAPISNVEIELRLISQDQATVTLRKNRHDVAFGQPIPVWVRHYTSSDTYEAELYNGSGRIAVAASAEQACTMLILKLYQEFESLKEANTNFLTLEEDYIVWLFKEPDEEGKTE